MRGLLIAMFAARSVLGGLSLWRQSPSAGARRTSMTLALETMSLAYAVLRYAGVIPDLVLVPPDHELTFGARIGRALLALGSAWIAVYAAGVAAVSFRRALGRPR